MTRNVSALHGLRSARAGYELTLSVSDALAVRTQLRWVNGEAQLADALTKGSLARKMMMKFFADDQRWQMVHDPDFVAGKKIKKRTLEQQMEQNQSAFVAWIRQLAVENRWPWLSADEPNELRIMGDERIGTPWKDTYPQ